MGRQIEKKERSEKEIDTQRREAQRGRQIPKEGRFERRQREKKGKSEMELDAVERES